LTTNNRSRVIGGAGLKGDYRTEQKTDRNKTTMDSIMSDYPSLQRHHQPVFYKGGFNPAPSYYRQIPQEKSHSPQLERDSMTKNSGSQPNLQSINNQTP